LWMLAPRSRCLPREDADFHKQTATEAVISFLQTYGRPHQITFDRDPRWVGSVAGRDFPSPLRRLLLCLGITPSVCPPHRPDKNAYVERYHRTYVQECLNPCYFDGLLSLK
jgi:transposase InsO family protein